jgi:hypothetical protein
MLIGSSAFFSRQELTRQDAMFVGLFNVREKKKKKENEKQSFAKDNDETISNIFLL